VLSVVVGIQAVGIVLMSAMLITPAAAARFWTHHIKPMIWIAVGFNIFSSAIGAYISYRFEGMPTGPWIVICLSIFALVSFTLAPQKGWLYQWYIQRKHHRKIKFENILKFLYKHQEHVTPSYNGCTSTELYEHFKPRWELFFDLKQLKYNGFIKKVNNNYQLTNEGLRKGQHITRLHRLWEMYLTKELNLPLDHVHDNADTVEHIIDPALESKLDQELNYPTVDPHQSNIPNTTL
jgi:manganese/zinc/iron transport system permease protein